MMQQSTAFLDNQPLSLRKININDSNNVENSEEYCKSQQNSIAKNLNNKQKHVEQLRQTSATSQNSNSKQNQQVINQSLNKNVDHDNKNTQIQSIKLFFMSSRKIGEELFDDEYTEQDSLSEKVQQLSNNEKHELVIQGNHNQQQDQQGFPPQKQMSRSHRSSSSKQINNLPKQISVSLSSLGQQLKLPTWNQMARQQQKQKLTPSSLRNQNVYSTQRREQEYFQLFTLDISMIYPLKDDQQSDQLCNQKHNQQSQFYQDKYICWVIKRMYYLVSKNQIINKNNYYKHFSLITKQTIIKVAAQIKNMQFSQFLIFIDLVEKFQFNSALYFNDQIRTDIQMRFQTLWRYFQKFQDLSQNSFNAQLCIYDEQLSYAYRFSLKSAVLSKRATLTFYLNKSDISERSFRQIVQNNNDQLADQSFIQILNRSRIIDKKKRKNQKKHKNKGKYQKNNEQILKQLDQQRYEMSSSNQEQKNNESQNQYLNLQNKNKNIPQQVGEQNIKAFVETAECYFNDLLQVQSQQSKDNTPTPQNQNKQLTNAPSLIQEILKSKQQIELIVCNARNHQFKVLPEQSNTNSDRQSDDQSSESIQSGDEIDSEQNEVENQSWPDIEAGPQQLHSPSELLLNQDGNNQNHYDDSSNRFDVSNSRIEQHRQVIYQNKLISSYVNSQFSQEPFEQLNTLVKQQINIYGRVIPHESSKAYDYETIVENDLRQLRRNSGVAWGQNLALRLLRIIKSSTKSNCTVLSLKIVKKDLNANKKLSKSGIF